MIAREITELQKLRSKYFRIRWVCGENGIAEQRPARSDAAAFALWRLPRPTGSHASAAASDWEIAQPEA
ncbi:Uncharacterized protein ChrSV_2877 [Chromobacterium vaccinii]|nr:Uncharacterized protein ChrSW_2877 [Chromobacterium vaccinii]QND90334.1 Uncharacterized protein ChrSV_2877 [Chromobacterium vaccinii]